MVDIAFLLLMLQIPRFRQMCVLFKFLWTDVTTASYENGGVGTQTPFLPCALQMENRELIPKATKGK